MCCSSGFFLNLRGKKICYQETLVFHVFFFFTYFSKHCLLLGIEPACEKGTFQLQRRGSGGWLQRRLDQSGSVQVGLSGIFVLYLCCMFVMEMSLPFMAAIPVAPDT